jgi:predicted RNA-binding protein with PIN domain
VVSDASQKRSVEARFCEASLTRPYVRARLSLANPAAPATIGRANPIPPPVAPMAVVIDGYNLLYAIGRLMPRTPRGALEGARRWLLEQLRSRHPPGADVTVVFDGGAAPPGRKGREDQLDLRVLFSHGESADDVIERLIQAAPSPASLTVVSDDHRLQQAGRKRGCEVLGCLDYYESDRPAPRQSEAPQPPLKPESSSPEEVERYLQAFGDLGDDPLLDDPY